MLKIDNKPTVIDGDEPDFIPPVYKVTVFPDIVHLDKHDLVLKEIAK